MDAAQEGFSYEGKKMSFTQTGLYGGKWQEGFSGYHGDTESKAMPCDFLCSVTCLGPRSAQLLIPSSFPLSKGTGIFRPSMLSMAPRGFTSLKSDTGFTMTRKSPGTCYRQSLPSSVQRIIYFWLEKESAQQTIKIFISFPRIPMFMLPSNPSAMRK